MADETNAGTATTEAPAFVGWGTEKVELGVGKGSEKKVFVFEIPMPQGTVDEKLKQIREEAKRRNKSANEVLVEAWETVQRKNSVSGYATAIKNAETSEDETVEDVVEAKAKKARRYFFAGARRKVSQRIGGLTKKEQDAAAATLLQAAQNAGAPMKDGKLDIEALAAMLAKLSPAAAPTA